MIQNPLWTDGVAVGYGLSVLVLAVLAGLAAARAPAQASPFSWRRDALFPLLLLLLLAAGRWPQMLIPWELNPDEAQFLAGAITLREDPVFWRSVDGMTAGPLVYYAPIPLAWLGLTLDFWTGRVLALLLLWGTGTAVYLLLAAHYGRRAAAWGVLPGLLFFALTTDADFNHYSSELVPVTLLAWSTFLLLRPAASPPLPVLVVGGLLAGSVPWAKLQAGPMAATLVVIAGVRLWRQAGASDRWRGLAALFGGCVLPALFFHGMLAWHNLTEDFWRSYVVQNLLYAEPNRWGVFEFGSRYLKFDFAVAGYAVVGLGALLGLCGGRRETGTGRGLFVASALLLVVSFACVLVPGNDFLHYTVLLLPALLLLHGAAWGAGALAPAGETSWGRAVLLSPVLLLALRMTEPPPPALVGREGFHRMPLGELAAVALRLGSGPEPIAVWGWELTVYVEAQAPQATSSAYSYWEIVPHPQRDYFRQRYLANLQNQRPPVFIDAVGPGNFYFADRASLGHESFPALATYIAEEYCLVAELGHARIYARRDRLAEPGTDQREIWAAWRAARPPAHRSAPVAEDIHSLPLPKDTAHGRYVASLRPPAIAEFPLTGRERAVSIGYGYMPEAEKQLEGNGTELSVTVVAPDGTPRGLAHFLHNPAHEPATRGHRSLHLDLPPDIAPDSRLRIASHAGPGGEEAWDWLYLTDVRMERADHLSLAQFPGFNRAPDAVSAPLASLTDQPRHPALLLHAPARLHYRLAGRERGLEFTFGFRVGAWEGQPGSTEGAVFRVWVRHPDGTKATLFERKLDPQRQPLDRGEQGARLSLPALPPGTDLFLEIDPDGSNAWDWTYVSGLRLG